MEAAVDRNQRESTPGSKDRRPAALNRQSIGGESHEEFAEMGKGEISEVVKIEKRFQGIDTVLTDPPRPTPSVFPASHDPQPQKVITKAKAKKSIARVIKHVIAKEGPQVKTKRKASLFSY
ncbi:hypothetical protein L1887_28800 [Cichorium endivia]|nr:hypothetical protein L1887_28800 [Cichorium endivia]